MLVRQAPFSTASLDRYSPLIGSEAVERIRWKAGQLTGLRVLHVNATVVGGGVAEMLLSLIPLMRDAGLDVDWYVLDGSTDFFEVTKSLHNGLQGRRVQWSPGVEQVYLRGNEHNAGRLANLAPDYDVVVVHDPQPFPLPSMIGGPSRWIWRCHIDLTRPDPRAWKALEPFLDPYAAAIFSVPDYVPAALNGVRPQVAMPAIDPFRPKNAPVSQTRIQRVLDSYRVDRARPYLLQVSRYDAWKDPLGVLEAYRMIKGGRRDLQLVYMAAMAADDPEGWRIYEAVRAAARGDPDVHLLALDVPVEDIDHNALEVNAFQRGAAVVLQKSVREGFGLTVAEALWKGKPVVAGKVGGLRYQVIDGWNGYLVDSVESCAERVAQLLGDRPLRESLARRGRETVRRSFLMPRLLEQYIDLFAGTARVPLDAAVAAGG